MLFLISAVLVLVVCVCAVIVYRGWCQREDERWAMAYQGGYQVGWAAKGAAIAEEDYAKTWRVKDEAEQAAERAEYAANPEYYRWSHSDPGASSPDDLSQQPGRINWRDFTPEEMAADSVLPY